MCGPKAGSDMRMQKITQIGTSYFVLFAKYYYCEDVEWTKLAHDRGQWCALMNIIMNLGIS
jgi:hypothetical protein